jgi:hypothetical protein
VTAQEKILAEKRLKDYAVLEAAAQELTAAIDTLEGGKHYTQNTSQIRRVEAVVIRFSDVENRLVLGANKIYGFQIKNELLELFREQRKLIWEALDKI